MKFKNNFCNLNLALFKLNADEQNLFEMKNKINHTLIPKDIFFYYKKRILFSKRTIIHNAIK
jgi:hypothetical protein